MARSSAFAAKSVVITGAAAGIGRELALMLAERGAHVWGIDLDEGRLDELAHEARKWGRRIETRRGDVTRVEDMALVRDELLARGAQLDYWVNNAGVAGLGGFLEKGQVDFDKVLAVNLSGLVKGTRVALEAMEASGTGRIVNMASVAGHLPAPYMTAYNAAKHGVVGFTRALQAELRLKDSPVSVLMVSPGFVDTGIIGKGEALGFPEWLSFMLATPQSVAAAVVRAMPTTAEEIYPALNGRLMKSMYRLFPRTTVSSSKILLTKSWKDVVLSRYGR